MFLFFFLPIKLSPPLDPHWPQRMESARKTLATFVADNLFKAELR